MSEKDGNDRTIIITEKVDVESQATKYEPYLIQISGRETGQMHNLSNQELVKMGRDAECQIVLDDPHVSRVHAEITITPKGNISIKDLGSTNGIFVNGNRVEESTLMDGDKILVGTRLYFKFCYQDAVEHSYQQNLFRAANIDGLTQLYNKKYFVDALSKEFSFSKRHQQPLSLMMLDIDHFKKINDTHGHLAGDNALQAVGQYLSSHIRMENIACRYGGEEFAIILRKCTQDVAAFIGERIRAGIEGLEIEYQGAKIPLTVSIGIATLDEEEFDTIEDFIQRADEYLYEAKQAGRNRTVLKKAA